MKKYRLFEIQWDTDGQPHDLPSEVTIEADDDWNPAEGAADALSDRYGFCVFGCAFETIDAD